MWNLDLGKKQNSCRSPSGAMVIQIVIRESNNGFEYQILNIRENKNHSLSAKPNSFIFLYKVEREIPNLSAAMLLLYLHS